MNTEKLIHMVNQMGDFFSAQPDAAAAQAGLTEHLRKFWAPAMRRQLQEALSQGQVQGLSPWAEKALREGQAQWVPPAPSGPAHS
jgi:formate dehydrogenase subunit delta